MLQPALRRADDGRHQHRVHAVHIKRDVYGNAFRQVGNGAGDAVRRQQMPHGVEGDTVIKRRPDIRLAGRADAARAKLHDLADMRHFRSAPHVAGQALSLAPDLVPPVDMRIDLQDRNRAASKTAIGFQHRNGNRIVATENKGHRAGIKKAGHGPANDLPVPRRDLCRGIGHHIQIAEIGGGDASRKHTFGRLHPEQVEIMLLQNRGPASRRADGVRRVMAVGSRRIGRCRANADNSDIDITRRVDLGARHVQPASGPLATEQVTHGRGVAHLHPPDLTGPRFAALTSDDTGARPADRPTGQ